MKCPICHGDVPRFRQHALQHIIADEAYGIEIFDREKSISRLILYPILGRLSKERLKELRQQHENATTTVIHRQRLVLIESRRKSVHGRVEAGAEARPALRAADAAKHP